MEVKRWVETMTDPMTAEEMEERLKAGEDPLELSIEKWKRIEKVYLDRTLDGSLMNAETCALCYIASDLDCEDCFFTLAHGKPCDVKQKDGSEYWWEATQDVRERIDRGHVAAMIEALEKCREDGS